jgi:hypothetical protein
MYFAGNYFPSYVDKSGSVARRFAVFPCVNVVTDRDTELVTKILRDEICTVMLRCIRRYHTVLKEKPGMGFWDGIAPQALVDVKDDLIVSTNPLADFLANGDEHWTIIYTNNKTDVTSLPDFRNAFEKHMRYVKKQQNYKMGDDYQPIKAAGFKIAKIHMCKVCNCVCSKQACGAHYLGGRNRTKKTLICHMKLVAKS